MDAISFLQSEHPMLSWLADEFEEMPTSAHEARATVVRRFRTDLGVHLALCEQLFYPATRALLPKLDGMVLDQLGAVWVMGQLSSEIGDLEEHDPQFEPKLSVLLKRVERHLIAAEDHLFPAVRAAMDPSDLDDLGQRLQQLRSVLVADPRPDGMGRPVAILSAAGSQVIEAATRAWDGAAARIHPDGR